MPSYSQVAISNMAIRDAGGNAINSVPDGNKKESDLIVTFWDITLEFLLAQHNWRFQKKWASLAEDATYTFIDDQYDAAWQLPSDFVRFSDQENVGPSAYVFERRGDLLLTAGLDEFEIEYIYMPNPTSVTGNFPTHFIIALYKALAYAIAPSLKRKGAKNKIDHAAEADRWLREARAMESQQDNKSEERKKRHTTENDTWLGARKS